MVSTQVTQNIQQWVVADPVEAFLTHLQNTDKSRATVRVYRIGLSVFREWFEENTGNAFEAVVVTPLDVVMYRDWLRDTRKLAPTTVNTYLAGLRAFLSYSLREGLVNVNAAKDVSGVRVDDPVPQWLGRQEQYQLLRTCENLVQLGDLRAKKYPGDAGAVWPKRDRALVRLMLAAGLRRAEVCALDVEDVIINERSGWVAVRNGKGGKARRVPINSDARKALSSWLEVHPLKRADGTFTMGTALFISQKGNRRLNKRSLADRIAVIAERANVAGVHPHTLRHTCAKNLIDAHEGIEKVSKILGHSKLETTLIYTQPSDADLLRAVEKTVWERN
ncbi:MAG: tyrosine-type recombinase/integrase [Anaerolineae bacterium]|nr:tyrosine-type recombinase/integrase [Anaerolineae bacterium]